ncbi:hypothetical protein [Pseudotabrizicola sp. 4114]|uniref:hypothetical protein n=1 Tax=Pseudotabrizicola sp. 4114 TaxID=2817731 RepID=UPI002866BC2A|nr:hypothetical protein [Pseudorhodobacter sp. 4114]
MTDPPDLQLFVNNSWRKTADTLPVPDRATEQDIGRLPISHTSDLAERGIGGRSRTAPRIRAQTGGRVHPPCLELTEDQKTPDLT